MADKRWREDHSEDELAAELADIRAVYARIVAGECAPDEKHCSCVPALRARIEELQAELQGPEPKRAHTTRASTRPNVPEGGT